MSCSVYLKDIDLCVDFTFCNLTKLGQINAFLVAPFSFPIHGIISSANRKYDSLLSNLHPFNFFFSCPMALSRTSTTISNSSGETGRPFTVVDLSGNACSFSPFSVALAVGLSFDACIVLKIVPYLLIFSCFIVKGCCILPNTSCTSTERIRLCYLVC